MSCWVGIWHYVGLYTTHSHTFVGKPHGDLRNKHCGLHCHELSEKMLMCHIKHKTTIWK